MEGASPGAAGSSSGSRVVRPAREADLDRVLEIHIAVFPDPRPIETRRRVFLSNRLGDFSSLRVVEQDGEILGHAFAFPVSVWFGGRPVRGSAIASVGVAPEARGQGLAGALLTSMEAEAVATGSAFSLLYPFRQGFYARHGYASVAPYRLYLLSPRAIPASWREAAPGRIRRARGSDLADLTRLHREAAVAGTGALDRSERAWAQDVLDERRQWLVLEDEGTLLGYLSFHLAQTEAHGRVTADVYELVSPHDAARRRLMAALAALGDQVGDVSLALADDDPLAWAFVDGDRDRSGTKAVEHSLARVATGPMIRLLDAPAALVARGYASDGAVSLALDGGAPFGLDVRDGTARLGPPQADTTLAMSTVSLASIAFGGLPLEDAFRLGWVDAAGEASTSAREAASRLLRVPAFFSVDEF